MLVVTGAMLDSMEKNALDRSNERLVDHLCARFPKYAHEEGRPEVGRLVAEQRDIARDHGIETERDLGTVMDASVMYGADFWSADWAADIFEIEHLEGDERATLLRERIEASGDGKEAGDGA